VSVATGNRMNNKDFHLSKGYKSLLFSLHSLIFIGVMFLSFGVYNDWFRVPFLLTSLVLLVMGIYFGLGANGKFATTSRFIAGLNFLIYIVLVSAIIGHIWYPSDGIGAMYGLMISVPVVLVLGIVVVVIYPWVR
jgi:hypothetical protein